MRKELSRLFLAGVVGVSGCTPLVTVDRTTAHKTERVYPTNPPSEHSGVDAGPIHKSPLEAIGGGGAWTIIGGGPDGAQVVAPPQEATPDATPSPSPQPN